jgi:hypothetical protein
MADDKPPLSWDPKYELPEGSVIATPAGEWVVFRLVKHDPPEIAAQDEVAIVQLDKKGRRVGEPIRHGQAVSA